MITTQPSQSETTAAANEKVAKGSNGHGRSDALPRLVATAENTEDRDELIRALRGFFVGATHELASPAAGTLPALLYPYRNAGRLRTDYPVCLDVRDGELECSSLGDQLEVWAKTAGTGGRVLDDNLLRFERAVRDHLGDAIGPVAARPLFAEAATGLEEQLGLDGEASDSLHAGLAAIVDQVPDGAALLGFGDGATANLAAAVAQAMVTARREHFAASVRELCNKLRSLIEVERSKDASARDPGALAASLANSSAQIDTSKLASILGPHRGTSSADTARRQRLEAALATLEDYLVGVAHQPVALFVARDAALVDGIAATGTSVVSAADPCAEAIAQFDRLAAELAVVLRAVRLARLEIDGNYVAATHAQWLEQLSWTGFSADELRLLTPVFAVEEATVVSGKGLRGLSALLRSGKPVKVLVEVTPADDPATGDAAGTGIRFELGYFAISHREALVHQTASARPVHLIDGLRRALDAPRASLHVMAAAKDSEGNEPALGGWLYTGAAIDGRAHPLFCYDPEPGESWARRFELGGNTDPEADWPGAELAYTGDAGVATMEVAFTFADFALLEPGYAAQLALVPDGAPSDVLVPLAEWLRLDDREAAPLVPYCWAVDGDGRLRRLVVSAELAFACRDRQQFWRTLQEWAGVHNEHVERAVADALAAAEERHAEELDRLAGEHADEVARVGREAAGDAMQKLAAALLDADIDAIAGVPAPAPVASIAAPVAAEAEAPTETEQDTETEAEAEAAPAAAELSFDEPFIDTPLCTSCNDCLAVSSVMFVYDENKQARIGDASAGTFEQLVRAAEKCPANCIHPGKPLNPDEANLEELIERAAEYN